MNSVIFKYDLVQDIDNTIIIGVNDRIMDIQVQHDSIVMWVQLDLTNRAKVRRVFRIVATGHEFDATNLNYLRTVQDKPFVWHVFEVMPHVNRKD